jgi:hypothetical protein
MTEKTNLFEPGWVVALMTDWPTGVKCYVGEVQAVSDIGIRLTLVDWFSGGFEREDIVVPWGHMIGSAVWTDQHEKTRASLEKWQNSFQGKGWMSEEDRITLLAASEDFK